MTSSRFLGRIPFSRALALEQDAWASVDAGAVGGVILGFDSEPVVTRGVRGSAQDLVVDATVIAARGFSLCEVDRGGQATIHNPGQLVVFPIFPVREIGARVWVESLAEISRLTLAELGIVSTWNEKSPGLYTRRGKIMACGVRIRHGISTHGVSINVSNNLADFDLIRACGIVGAPVDRIGEGVSVREVFDRWCTKFHETHG